MTTRLTVCRTRLGGTMGPDHAIGVSGVKESPGPGCPRFRGVARVRSRRRPWWIGSDEKRFAAHEAIAGRQQISIQPAEHDWQHSRRQRPLPAEAALQRLRNAHAPVRSRGRVRVGGCPTRPAPAAIDPAAAHSRQSPCLALQCRLCWIPIMLFAALQALVGGFIHAGFHP